MYGHMCWRYVLAALITAAFAIPSEQVLLNPQAASAAQDSLLVRLDRPRRPLHGRFLHVTDFHPDRFYEVYSSTEKDAACHRGRGPAGLYGAETSECDSPIDLVNKTFEWLDKEFKDKIDFIIWTGDSARHDNDEEIPRSAEQVIGLNQFMVNKMFETFGKHDGDEEDNDPNNDYVVPIIPTFGNNDILPHNVMTKGPNSWTRTYASVWRQFIPEEQKHQFEQGGWFYVEVIPNKLAVFSLNTIYFFVSNAAADGCAAHSEPGYQQMEWLRIQLRFMRERGMKAILTGHVPPVRQDAKSTWDETCWQKYALWLRQYRDVIVGSLYGHFNYDHFTLQDFNDIDKATEEGRMDRLHVGGASGDGDFQSTVSADYFIQLREQWSKLPKPPKGIATFGNEDELANVKQLMSNSKPDKSKKKLQQRKRKYLRKVGGRYAERFASSFVSASVVPNLYPAVRVFEYNITGLDQHLTTLTDFLPLADVNHGDVDAEVARSKKNRFVVPDPPSKSAPPGPAYSPQTLSLLKFTQYFANITRINNDFHGASHVTPVGVGAAKWNEGKHRGKTPHDRDYTPTPKSFAYELHYDTRDDDVYRLQDLTMPNLLGLARWIGDFVPEKDKQVVDEELDDADIDDEDDTVDRAGDGGKRRKHRGKRKGGKKAKKHRKRNEAWYTFVRRAFVETMDAEELEEQFGH